MFDLNPTGLTPEHIELGLRISATGQRTINLSGVDRLSPYLLAIAPIIFSSPGDVVQIEGDNDRLSTLQFRTAFAELGTDIVMNPPRPEKQSVLMALNAFRGSDLRAAERLSIRMSERCFDLGLKAEDADIIAGHAYELCNNAVAHAQCERAWIAASLNNVHGELCLEFAVADDGRGIRASLQGTEYEESTDAAAIATASRARTSAIGRPNHGGIGLSAFLEWVRSQDGSSVVRSGSCCSIVDERGDNIQLEAVELPGTVVGYSIGIANR